LADDELNQNPEGEESGQSQALTITELEDLVAQKDEELTKANTRITELEQTVTESDEKLTTIKNSLTEAVRWFRQIQRCLRSSSLVILSSLSMSP